MLDSSFPPIKLLVSRLANISDMIVESFDPKSNFCLWAKQSSFANQLQARSAYLDILIAMIPSYSTWAPPAITEISSAFRNIKVNPVYLENLFGQPRYEHVLSFYSEHISLLEEIYHSYISAEQVSLGEDISMISQVNVRQSLPITPYYNAQNTPSSSQTSWKEHIDNDYLQSLFEKNDLFYQLSLDDPENKSVDRFRYAHALVYLYRHNYPSFSLLLNSQSCLELIELAYYLNYQAEYNFRLEHHFTNDYQEIIDEANQIRLLRKFSEEHEILEQRKQSLEDGRRSFKPIRFRPFY